MVVHHLFLFNGGGSSESAQTFPQQYDPNVVSIVLFSIVTVKRGGELEDGVGPSGML